MMADRNDFMIDEDLSEYDDFLSRKGRSKIKQLYKMRNTAKHKLPPHLRDGLMTPTPKRGHLRGRVGGLRLKSYGRKPP